MKKKELAIIICLLIIEIISLFLMYKSSNNNEEYIFEINSTEEINYNNIAIMIEKKDGTGYEESTTNKWPTNMEFNNELSGCVDKNGNRIEEALSYENGIAKVNTSTTSYCYLFFDNIETDEPEVTPDEKIGLCTANDKLGECLYNSRTNIASLSDNLEGGLYRYQGTNEIVNDNYVCFGINDKNECINNLDKYMYRIIGIDENRQIKLIKYHALEDAYYWYENRRTYNTWINSRIYSYINGDKFLSNTNYIPTGWENLISSYDWKYGAFTSTDYATKVTANYVYSFAKNWTDTVNAKIGLMYMHDYSYGLNGDISCMLEYETCKTSWIFLGNNDSNPPYEDEWTMTFYKRMTYANASSDGYEAWFIPSWGGTSYKSITYLSSVRPVFYLNVDVMYASGLGTSSNPFILK